MLILTRRPVETIYIGEDVTVTVLGVVGNQVRFGIEAPRHVVIDRAEIHERKKRAALGTPGNAGPQGSDRNRGPDAATSGDANGNVLEEEEGNVATLKLRR